MTAHGFGVSEVGASARSNNLSGNSRSALACLRSASVCLHNQSRSQTRGFKVLRVIGCLGVGQAENPKVGEADVRGDASGQPIENLLSPALFRVKPNASGDFGRPAKPLDYFGVSMELFAHGDITHHV